MVRPLLLISSSPRGSFPASGQPRTQSRGKWLLSGRYHGQLPGTFAFENSSSQTRPSPLPALTFHCLECRSCPWKLLPGTYQGYLPVWLGNRMAGDCAPGPGRNSLSDPPMVPERASAVGSGVWAAVPSRYRPLGSPLPHSGLCSSVTFFGHFLFSPCLPPTCVPVSTSSFPRVSQTSSKYDSK